MSPWWSNYCADEQWTTISIQCSDIMICRAALITTYFTVSEGLKDKLNHYGAHTCSITDEWQEESVFCCAKVKLFGRNRQKEKANETNSSWTPSALLTLYILLWWCQEAAECSEMKAGELRCRRSTAWRVSLYQRKAVTSKEVNEDCFNWTLAVLWYVFTTQVFTCLCTTAPWYWRKKLTLIFFFLKCYSFREIWLTVLLS